ncbi:hypothetical protein DFH27DRAFT_654047 [Peziza echinospora]|nr:hypothetical protein DFH27DRAFT_654047 [Peziza echinospora]
MTQGQLRRAKSSPTATAKMLVPGTTRSDRLTPHEMQAQARAAAAQAFKNDLMRKSESNNPRQERGQNIRFGQTPLDHTIQSFHPHPSDGDVFMMPSSRNQMESYSNNPMESSPHRMYNPTYIATAPSSYRRLRRSRSLFSVTHPKAFDPVGAPERSMTFNGSSLKPRRSMSFLRGGTEFMPSSYRRDHFQPTVKERKPLYYFGSSSFRGDKNPTGDAGQPEKPRSLRMKVRKMSATVVNSVKRAFLVGSGKDEQPQEMPVQHVVSNRPYFGDYSTLSDRRKQGPMGHNNLSQDIFMSQVSSGAPSLRKVPSSVGYPSRSGSIRIVTPPTRSSTPLSSSGNTWATSTASTLRSGTGSKRLSIIREATPKNDGERDNNTTPTRSRNKALDTQRVYSAFLRVSRAKNAEAEQELERIDSQMQAGAELPRSASAQSHSTTRSTIKKSVTFSQDPFQTTSNHSEASIRSVLPDGNKENTPPLPLAQSQKPMGRTHITIGPRITLYPPPSVESEDAITADQNSSMNRGENNKSMRSYAGFFPYSEGQLLGGSTPSPYKRATAMSPDAPSIYSRTTSGETPRPFLADGPTPRPPSPFDSNDSENQFVQLGRKVSLVQMKRSNENFKVLGNYSAPTPSNTPGSYYTAKTRKDENLPISTYIPGLMRPGETTIPAERDQYGHSTASSFGLSFFRGRQINNRRVTITGEGNRTAAALESTKKHRVLTAKTFQGTITGPEALDAIGTGTQPLSKIDSNTGTMTSQGSKKSNWGLGIGKRLLSHSQPSRESGLDINEHKAESKDRSVTQAFSENSTPTKENFQTYNGIVRGTSDENVEEIAAGASARSPPKFSFELNDDRVITTSALGDRFSNASASASANSNSKPRVRGPRALVQKTYETERRNSSVSSSIGAFL